MRRQAGIGAATIVLACVLVLASPALARILVGTRGDDRLIGRNVGDKIIGKAGDDVLGGRKGGDLIAAGKGADRVNGGKGFDEIKAGKGPDLIKARDGRPDLIDCGQGMDTVFVDEVEEGIYDCEEVIEPDGTP